MNNPTAVSVLAAAITRAVIPTASITVTAAGAFLAAVAMGAIVGALVGVGLLRRTDGLGARSVRALRREVRDLAHQGRLEAAESRDAAVRAAISEMTTLGQALSDKDRERSVRELAGQRELIESRLDLVRDQLSHMDGTVRALERDREAKFAQLAGELRRQHDDVRSLAEATSGIRAALAGQQSRGQWGERMADDVLRCAGFVEGVNYERQRSTAGAGRPDYTFLLPGGLVLHMDVKFPLDNYARSLESASDADRKRHRDRFLADVGNRLRDLARRNYTDGEDSVDCLLAFIPNESIYAFVQQHGPHVVDRALADGIVVCSPLTLFAVLAVVRQAVDHFRLERTSSEIVASLRDFAHQWDRFTDALDGQQRRFETLAREFESLAGTRRRALDRSISRIDALSGADSPRSDGSSRGGDDEDVPRPSDEVLAWSRAD